MDSAPKDLDPEEEEFMELFGALRGEVFHIMEDLASLILVRIERRQADDERLQPPEPFDVVGSGLASLLSALTGIFKPADASGEEPPGPPQPSDDEDDDRE